MIIEKKLYNVIFDSIIENIESVNFIKTNEQIPFNVLVSMNDFKTIGSSLVFEHSFSTDDIKDTKEIQFLNSMKEVLISKIVEPPIDVLSGGEDILSLRIYLTEEEQ